MDRDTTNESRRHRIVVVGAGGVSSMHFDGLQMRPERVDVVAAVDPSAERREWAATTYGVPNLFSSIAEAVNGIDFDVAIVSTPTHVRLAAVEELAAAGKHILVEKPMADGMVEARAMVAAASAAGVQLAVDQNFRDHYPFDLARQQIEQGLIGRVRAIEHRDLMLRRDTGWRNEQPHHALMVMGVHWLDGFRMLAGKDADWIVATTYSSPSVGAAGESDASVQVRFGDVTANYTESFSSWIGHTDTIVLGETGTLEVTSREVTVANESGVKTLANELSLPENKPLSAYRALEQLLDAIESGVEPANSGNDNLKTISLIEAAYQSALSKSPVELRHGLLQ